MLARLFGISSGSFRYREAGGSGDGGRAKASVDGVGEVVELAVAIVLGGSLVGKKQLLSWLRRGQAADAHAEQADATDERRRRQGRVEQLAGRLPELLRDVAGPRQGS